ncbi:hypothetical protein K488DRAFT_85126 [Vararia minispora EC-137]|uniref:Uncharacterized protein n=1 Tax=Vararia minispora EC-137 TaxID=1314806 RepID=A0ACB8QNF3_9AGAM|nr:hypothetical protein K488DRAFT_85126 [Vararia minispora EC-137]
MRQGLHGPGHLSLQVPPVAYPHNLPSPAGSNHSDQNSALYPSPTNSDGHIQSLNVTVHSPTPPQNSNQIGYAHGDYRAGYHSNIDQHRDVVQSASASPSETNYSTQAASAEQQHHGPISCDFDMYESHAHTHTSLPAFVNTSAQASGSSTQVRSSQGPGIHVSYSNVEYWQDGRGFTVITHFYYR